jgi:EAL domain-containing protein (putative c-di-GMP-specific phosphodiesterase class I)
MTNNFNETVLILDRDRDAAASAGASIATAGRLVLTGCDAAVAGLVMARLPISAVVADLGIAGPFSFDGLDVVSTVRGRTADCRIFATGSLSMLVSDEARRRGACEVVDRPASLGEYFAGGDGGGVLLHIPTIDEIITSDHLGPAFQPIVDLAGDRCHGFESLARYREAALPFCYPQFMFDYARLTGRTAELELACLRRTIRAAGPRARDAKLFANIHPHAFRDERLARTLVQEASDHGVPLTKVVLEITEQEKLEATPRVLETITTLRSAGVEFALDDVGMSYSHLDLIGHVRPSYLKISHAFGTGFEQDTTRTKIVRNILALARDFDCEVVLEGVESEATSGAAEALGARYAQGYFYAEPA